MKIVCTTQGKGTNLKKLKLVLRAKCFSISGVKFWNGLRIALKTVKLFLVSKKFTKHLYLIDTKGIFYSVA